MLLPFASSLARTSRTLFAACSRPSSLAVESSSTWLPTFARTMSITGFKNPKNKIKTHKGTAKRWSPIPNGQYKRGRPGKRHLNVTLSSERLNRLGQTAYATPGQVKQLKRLLPGQ